MAVSNGAYLDHKCKISHEQCVFIKMGDAPVCRVCVMLDKLKESGVKAASSRSVKPKKSLK